MTEDERLKKQKERYERSKAEKPTLCRICGKVVPPIYTLTGRMASRHYHEECIIDEAYKAILDGYTMKNNAALRRAKNYEYTRAEILAIKQGKGIK